MQVGDLRAGGKCWLEEQLDGMLEAGDSKVRSR